MFMEDELGHAISLIDSFIPEIKMLHPTFKPKYVSRIIEKVYNAALFELINSRAKDDFIRETNDIFLQRLAISTG